ncbi:MAG: hypothetical protein PUJ66_00055 [Faecalibacterium sp.]|nr:hypothetical protein [Faecalibacterium sp.]
MRAAVAVAFAKLLEIVMPLYTGTCFSLILPQAAKMHVKMTAIVKMAKILKIRCFWVFIFSLAVYIAGIFKKFGKNITSASPLVLLQTTSFKNEDYV